MPPQRRARPLYLALAASMVLVAILGCELPGSSARVENAVEQTVAARETQAAAAGGASGVEGPATEETPAPPVAPPEAGPSPTVTPTVVHSVFPSNPAAVQSYMTDVSSASTAGQRYATGDNFDTNRMERPFSSQVMDYLPYLDITRGELSVSSPFMYAVIFLEEAPPPDVEATYGVEIDLDLDGRGDWLITGELSPSTDWTTDGVRAFRDANGDVGGANPVQSDSPPQTGNGYEDLVFDQGLGSDPDAAWIRRSPTAADQIQIAFKAALIGFDEELLWGVWADAGVNQPGWFDYHDHFTRAEAGSPLSGNTYYPILALAALDNSCRWTYDFTPTDQLPGMCILPPTPTPVLPGQVTGVVWRDNNWDGVRGLGDSVLPGISVTLRSGSCGGSVVATTTTIATGRYLFTNLTPGSYCVSVAVTAVPYATCGCGDYCQVASTSNPRTVTVPSGGDAVADFGFFQQAPC